MAVLEQAIFGTGLELASNGGSCQEIILKDSPHDRQFQSYTEIANKVYFLARLTINSL